MAILKNSIIKEIQDTIANSNQFSKDDFKFEFPNEGKILAYIEYRASKQYSFSIEENVVGNFFALGLSLENKKIETVIQTRQKPGNHKNEEIFTHENIDECIKKIRNWLFNLDIDLKSIVDFDVDTVSYIDDFEEKLNKKFTSETEKFTDFEKEDLFKKLDELQKRIEQLEQDVNSKKAIENIEQSKNELETYPKKSWWLKFYNRAQGIQQGVHLALEYRKDIDNLLDIIINALK
ncbi:hypothetical protein FA592_02275 [Sulfurospirillum diekertiae]|uniref:Uncharacterized protein n=1 Tax=Sulfurospirillum diekertiae TaxID=1854492 RepID=A0A6G9VP30_9BACT|nr:hypothetical protein [Sulfurospirillum diekertiae]QIR75105.1 hypothetical protein FA584_02285 [Sulfurospirillum diekertiae]QIR77769.1 hypothetical protein FA592_02275 [Sulfurospirillum diekertiae]